MLVFFYSIAMVLITGAIYGVVLFISRLGGPGDPLESIASNPIDPAIFSLTLIGVFIVVGGGSLFRMAQLSAGGGKAVAEMLGGRLINPGTRVPAERRLYNVVEEIALASGAPMPPVYIMDNEPSINAFAAGTSVNEAVVSVNRGTLELLTRDELQGVLGHEFSHVVNGDCRINMRLMGVLFGLQLIALIGQYMMRIPYYMNPGYGYGYGGRNYSGFDSGNQSSQDDNNNRSSGAGIMTILMIGGVAIMVIGFIGVFFSAIIKAAVSRQRELLADATAVQYTRNPAGIAGALKKIGCAEVGSDVLNPHAAEASHMFFGNVASFFSLGNLFATHPDLTFRIQQIDPSFNGVYPDHIEPVRIDMEQDERDKMPKPNPFDPMQKINPANGMGHIGGFGIGQILAAGGIFGSMPQQVSDNTQDPLSAKATVYAILLNSENAEVQQKQLQAIAAVEPATILPMVQKTFGTLQGLGENMKIPLFMKVTATLKLLSKDQYKQFSNVVDALINADLKMDLLEYTLKAVMLRDLDVHFGLAPTLTEKYSTLASVQDSVAAVLSFLAYAGHDTPEEAEKVFVAIATKMGLSSRMLGNEACTIKLFDQALRILALTTPTLKKQVFEGMVQCVQEDGKITALEGELIRAIAAMLAVPMPNWTT